MPITGKPDLAALMLRLYEERDRPDSQYQDITQFASNENYDANELAESGALWRARHKGLTSLDNDGFL